MLLNGYRTKITLFRLTKLDVMLKDLSKENRQQLVDLITEFPSLFSDTPSCTDLIYHNIDVGKSLPIRQRFYCVFGS